MSDTPGSLAAYLPVGTAAGSEGTWASPGYRSSGTRSRWARALLVFTAVLAGLGALLLVQGIVIVNHYLDGTLTDNEAASWLRFAYGLSGWEIIGSIAAGIAFVAWLSRAVENEPPLGAGRQKESPRQAIGWWFVPLASLWMPYRIVRNLWDRMALRPEDRGHALLRIWWLAFVLGGALERVIYYLIIDAGTAEEVRGLLLFGGIAELTTLLAAICGFLVVREIERRARARALSLGLVTPDARWPAGIAPLGDSGPNAGTGDATHAASP